MKQEKTNTWKDGLNLDLHPIVTPNTVLTDCLNGTFITYNGNEFCLQNNRGNTNTGAQLSEGFVPIGVKEHNGVLYIVSVNNETNFAEIGTYPGVNWDETEGYLNPKNYTPLKNYIKITDTISGYTVKTPEFFIDNSSVLEFFENIYKSAVLGFIEDSGGKLVEDSISPNGNTVRFEKEANANLFYGKVQVFFRQNDLRDEPPVWTKHVVYVLHTKIIPYCSNLTRTESITPIHTEVREFINFNTDSFKFDVTHPVTIEIQDSYDGSVNLIMTDRQNQPRIVNSGFSVLPNNKYKLINRNQETATNVYFNDTVESTTRLIENIVSFAYFDLDSITAGGQLKGGNYTFYAKYGDSDGNQTDVCAESGTVSIFKGNLSSAKTISGTLGNERTDKLVKLTLLNLDKSYDKIYLYAVREYSDTSGYLMTEAFAFEKPFDIIKSDEDDELYCCNIVISGIENITSINIEDLNISYHTINSTKTITQQQDMLFLGNVTKQNVDYQNLSSFAKCIKTYLCRKNDSKNEDDLDNLIPVSFKYENMGEYYDPENIYYKVGYYPGEYYRFGIVFMFENGSISNVFNMCGGDFVEFTENSSYKITDFIDGSTNTIGNWNEYGVFRLPMETSNTKIINPNSIIPWHIHFDLQEMINEIKDSDYAESIVGYIIVRQKRIPEAITQGLQTGVEYYNHVPLSIIPTALIDESKLDPAYAQYGLESFVTKLTNTSTDDSKLLYIAETVDGEIISDYNNYNICRTIHIKSWREGISTDPRNRTYYAIMNYQKGVGGIVISISKDYNSDLDFRDGCTLWFDPRNNSVRTSRPDRNGSTRISDSTYTRAESKYILYDSEDEAENKVLKEYLEDVYASDENYIASDTNAYSLKNWLRTNTNTNDNSNYKIRIDENSSALLTLDPVLVNETKSLLNGSEVTVEAVSTIKNFYIGGRHVNLTDTEYKYDPYNSDKVSATFVDSDNYGKSVGPSIFVSSVGNAYDSSKFGYLGYFDASSKEWKQSTLLEGYHDRVIRGLYTPYVGLKLKLHQGTNEKDFNDFASISSRSKTIHGKYIDNPALILQLSNRTDPENAFAIRKNDNSEYYAVSNRIPISTTDVAVYRGDCYSTTQTIRMIRNFIDPTAPYTEIILKENAWSWTNVKPNSDRWDEVNISDLNTVSLGHWITFKCLSNYNIGLRSVDPFNVTESSIMGNERSFYPLIGSTATANKIKDSTLLNSGYSQSVGRKRYELEQNTPYIKSEFSNRVMFSNKNVTDQFINGYRVFQGLSYHDYDKQYGEIVKLLPWDNNLFCVFEHGLSILPINEKALIQTTTEQTIHIYGHSVLPDTMTLISADYGSQYPDSVVRTPIGIYGLDMSAKKIWRFSKNNGFETLSDMKIESYLNDNIISSFNWIDISDSCNVRTEYDSFKGDVIFRFNDDPNGGNHNSSITFNERQNLWITKNDWYPLLSENINGTFYTLAWPHDSTNVYIYKHVPESPVTQWYGQQHPFEFEFVVSDPVGVHKIIDNLQIISNNCQPEELTFEIIGDSYMFNKDKLTHLGRGENTNLDVVTQNRNKSDILNKDPDPNFPSTTIRDNTKNETMNNFIKNKAKISQFGGTTRVEDTIVDSTYEQDIRTKQYHLRIPQECRNIETWGRRLGNIHYSEDSWYTNVEPIRFDAELLQKEPNTESNVIKEARIRDKWCKIRVRYTGEDLAVITAIKTSINI